jgi:XTP/dITP diphosphohydrolase
MTPDATRRIVLATRSAGKLRELAPMLATYGWQAVTLDALDIDESPDEDALEVFETFEENALAKARWFADRTREIVIADDSGLSVDALGGAPGVRSKRWMGRADLEGAELDAANNAHLLAPLTARAAGGDISRRAHYVCAAACVWSGGSLVTRGETHGLVLDAARGTGGFGYDPLFLSDDLGVTFAEASRDAKAGVSHRGRAMRALCEALAIRLTRPA